MIQLRFLVFIFLFSVTTPLVIAQEKDLELAEEYYRREDYDKARDVFDKVLKKHDVLLQVYPYYTVTLTKLKDFSNLEKFYKKVQKKHPEKLEIRIDYGLFLKDQGKDKEADKQFKSIIDEVKFRPDLVELAARYIRHKGNLELTQTLYIESRAAMRQPYLYIFEMAELYKIQGKTEQLIEEMLTLAQTDPASIYQVQNIFQNNLVSPKDLDLLESKLLNASRNSPGDDVYNELLYWLYLQQQDFKAAFMQAKAIDKRKKTDGQRIMELGSLAMNNNDFEAAIRIYEYYVEEFAGSPYFYTARRNLIAAREQLVKSKFPVAKDEVRALINAYFLLERSTNNPSMKQDIVRNIAQLYALYLGQIDTAIVLIEQMLRGQRVDKNTKLLAKLDLGDYYLLRQEPWEASLIYSQVEKEEKDAPLGYEAKLRNARLFYFKGEFELAKEQLNILKLATAREIANDALELSLRIQDNLGLDSTGDALMAYSKAELLLFQNKVDESLLLLDSLLKAFPNHSLTDEIYLLKFKIFEKTGRYNEAIQQLNIINEKYSEDIYGDDALFHLGRLHEEKLKQPEKAMEYYQELMKKFPGSIFVAEARKRFRTLRGDKLN
jgi:tetratricopeptide (TPR) repeat protein